MFGWDRDRDWHDGFFYPLTPLVGFWTGEHSGGWLFPLFSQHRARREQSYKGNVLWAFYSKHDDCANSWMFPFYAYNNRGPVENALAPCARSGTYGKSFWCLPICWYNNEARVFRGLSPVAAKGSPVGTARSATNDVTIQRIRENGCFPLWSYATSSTDGSSQRETSASVLLLLYDYKREVRAAQPADLPVTDYTRSRVLWHVWHYERSDDNVSVDVFPAITYDRKGTEFKKITFLWRFFRYERGKDQHKLDLLFVPILR